MKTFTNTLILLSMACCAAGCHIMDVGYVNPIYQLVNESGHTVSIAHKPTYMEMPDSLILPNGAHFDLSAAVGWEYFHGTNFKTRILYYDGRYRIDIQELPLERQMQEQTNYYNTDKEAVPLLYVFTLTESDYAYAVEHGTDLMAK